MSPLVLSSGDAAFLSSGGCDLPIPAASGLAPGNVLRLRSPSAEPLGLAVADPENGFLRLLARAGEPFGEIDAAFFQARVARALDVRRALGLKGAYRLLHGAGDGLPGFAADVFGAWAVLYVDARGLLQLGRVLASALLQGAGLRGVVLKLRARGAAARGRIEQELLGEAPPERLVVEERGVPFEVHLAAGLNVGLFTDMREHRQALARSAAGRTVLNAFSYTGTLSVAAARAGATVTSVDLSSGVQAWARDNFRLSGLDPERHRFEAADAMAYLLQARRVGRRFDLVLLDPPSFSAARGAPFAIERDYPELIARSCSLLAEGGLLWLASNTRAIDLAAIARHGLRRSSREAELLETGGLPPDHPTLPSQPEDRYLQVLVFRLR